MFDRRFVFPGASSTIRTSTVSMSSKRAGLTQASCSSLPCVSRFSVIPSSAIRGSGCAPASSTRLQSSRKIGAARLVDSSVTRSPSRTRVQKLTSTSAIRSWRLSDMLDGARRRRVAQEAAVLPDQLAVSVHLAFLTEVADQVEVKRGPVPAAQVLEAHSEGQVHRAADLLVEEDVAREAVDLIVEPERELAHAGCSFVHREERLEVRLSTGGLGFDDAALFEPKPDVVHLATVEHGRKGEPDRAVDACLHRAGVDLAVRDVLTPVSRAPGSAFDDDGEIGVLADDVELPNAAELAGPRLQLLPDPPPV